MQAASLGQQAGRDCCVRGWEQRLPCLMPETESRALYRLIYPDLGVRRVGFPPDMITLAVR
jgi:hypothetical protein